ncbi:MAG TPA: rhamnogalacturonan acetylesterase [Longimicrobiaceae bacterium]|nr:rhamnogalacturonan acetylesterase [Longimicrobiaceae bacterium]
MIVRKAELLALSTLLLSCALAPAARAQATTRRFECTRGALSAGAQRIGPKTVYTAARGYGFLRSFEPTEGAGACASDKPFLFAVDVPEGRYDVEVTLGDPARPTTTTVKAESRRLMLEAVPTRPGDSVTRRFTVDVHRYHIAGGDSVRRKPREMRSFTWDDRLTLEFNGEHPAVQAISIRPARNPIAIYLAGNSTVVDQQEEPWAAWGQMVPRFFRPDDVVVANHAESGETLKSFVGERRLEKILSVIQPGDYLFVEFAHNDQKPGRNHVEPFTTYQEMIRHFIDAARAHGANPVLVTSTQRRNFDANGKVVNTLGDYPAAMRQLAAEEHLPLIDLTAMTSAFYEALGPEDSKKAFVHYPAGTFPGQTQDLKDDTHFNDYGAYEVARMVVQALRDQHHFLARYLKDDVTPFEPSHPDPVASFDVPRSPFTSTEKPAGS